MYCMLGSMPVSIIKMFFQVTSLTLRSSEADHQQGETDNSFNKKELSHWLQMNHFRHVVWTTERNFKFPVFSKLVLHDRAAAQTLNYVKPSYRGVCEDSGDLLLYFKPELMSHTCCWILDFMPSFLLTVISCGLCVRCSDCEAVHTCY